MQIYGGFEFNVSVWKVAINIPSVSIRKLHSNHVKDVLDLWACFNSAIVWDIHVKSYLISLSKNRVHQHLRYNTELE